MKRLGNTLPGPNTARKWVAVFTLLAFFLQGLAVQTHIHPSLQSAVAKTAAQHLPGSAPVKNQDPVDQCRLCQELIHAGAFVAPSAAVPLASPAFIVAALTVRPSPAEQSALAFSWQSRAPPRR